MVSVAKKILTKPFGGELPPDLIEAFNELLARRGWTKKRALAACVRLMILADPADQEDWYFVAYDSLEPVGDPERITEQDEDEASVRREADRGLDIGRRLGEEHRPARSRPRRARGA